MSIFSVSTCMLENVTEEKCYITGVLHKFAEQSNKVAVDREGAILDIYSEKAMENPTIAYWIDLMSMIPSNFESVTDTLEGMSKETLDVFVFIASKIPSNPKLIVYSTSVFNGAFVLDKKSRIIYGDKQIKVLDRDKAFDFFNKKTVIKKTLIKDSIVASKKSKIKDVKR